MTNQQRLLVAIVFVVAVVGGGILALTALGGGSGASPSPLAAASPSPAVASTVPSDRASESASPSEAPSSGPTTTPSRTPAPSPTATATPRPTTAPGEAATVILSALKLDAKDDPAGKNRKISFQSQGAGTIAVALKVGSPQGSATMCLAADGVRLACKTTADGTLTAKTTKPKAAFVLTLRGDGIETPVVDATITFPATNPAITIANARFDGTAFPETNGLQAFVTPRRDGDVTVQADWGGHPFLYEVDLLEQNGGPGTHVLPNQGPATRVAAVLPVTAPNPWKLLLQNIEDGFGVTDLVATIAWP